MSALTRRLLALAALAAVWLPPTAAPAQTSADTSSYLELLARYADGLEEEALRRLLGLERQLTADELARVRQLRFELVEDLRPFEARVIPPVIALHERTYLAYRAEGAVIRSLHARATMLLLCDLLAERVLTTPERRLAGGWFASLGGYSQETSTGPIAMSLFQRALAVDPSNEAALLGAATDLEKHGRYAKAVPFLEQLLRAHPQSSEGRLRFAINLHRMGRSIEATAHLRKLLDTEAPPWILSLAHQALARQLMDASHWDRARDVLAQGVARHPEDHTLALALAYVIERLTTDSGDLRLVAGQSTSDFHGSRQRPPRFVYARFSAEAFARLRRRLRSDSQASLHLLAAALAERHAPACS